LSEDKEDGCGGREWEGVGEVVRSDATMRWVFEGVGLTREFAQLAEVAVGSGTQNRQGKVGNPITHGLGQVGRDGEGKEPAPVRGRGSAWIRQGVKVAEPRRRKKLVASGGMLGVKKLETVPSGERARTKVPFPKERMEGGWVGSVA
jgi:hypothetical protein